MDFKCYYCIIENESTSSNHSPVTFFSWYNLGIRYHEGVGTMIKALYIMLRAFGDAKAVGNGTYHKRVAKRAIRRPINRGINKLFK